MLFSDPTSTYDGKQPIYLASQFYGGGRVVFQGSGEMWRIREVDENLFNTYWTKLGAGQPKAGCFAIQILDCCSLIKRKVCLGEQISVRAVLKIQLSNR